VLRGRVLDTTTILERLKKAGQKARLLRVEMQRAQELISKDEGEKANG